MSQFTPGTVPSQRTSSGLNVYTFLLLVAFLALLVACGYVVYRHHELYGSWNPLDLAKTVAVAGLSFF